MNLVFLGPPGAGKGTQTQRLIENYNMFALSTGDLLRQAVKNETKLGLEAKSYMDKGSLVPDTLMIRLIEEKLDNLGDNKSVIFDGFPRTIAQAEALDELLLSKGQQIDVVLEIIVDESDLIKRITGRYICNTCNSTYHEEFNPTVQEGVCDYCKGTQFFKRSDDKAETLLKRLSLYNEEKNKIKPFYEEKKILYVVDGSESKEDVAHNIDEILQRETLTYQAIKV